MSVPSNDPICTCKVCRQAIRDAVVRILKAQRRWMSFHSLVYSAELAGIPALHLRSIMKEMVKLGVLIEAPGQDDELPRYMLSRLVTQPVKRRRG